jgi:CubicO group peptidase (beta-lactamase class C family)
MLITQVRDLLDERERAGAFSGVVALYRGGTALFENAYGFANRAWSIPNRLDTRFRIASVSKLFTAVAILQLIDRDQLALDTRVTDLLQLAPTTISPDVTIHHLLTMTAGIADWFEESEDWEMAWEQLAQQHPIHRLRTNRDYLPLFAQKPPVAMLGARHQYSNASYILLGLAIEQIAGGSYFDYIRQHIFSPAAMSRSDFIALDEVAPDVAEGYIPVAGAGGAIIGWRRNLYATTPAAAADGGAISTTADLHRFVEAIRNHALLSEASTWLLLTPHVDESEEPHRGYHWKYGYGSYFLVGDRGKVIRSGLPGEEAGVSCRLFHYPQHQLDLIVLGNQSECAGALGWKLHDLIIQSSS